MRLLRVGQPGAERPAVLGAAAMARDVSGIAEDFGLAFFASGGLARLAVAVPNPVARAILPALDGRAIGAPIARPGRVVGIGLNYSDRAAETGAAIPERPVVFVKDPSAESIHGAQPGDLINTGTPAAVRPWPARSPVPAGGRYRPA